MNRGALALGPVAPESFAQYSKIAHPMLAHIRSESAALYDPAESARMVKATARAPCYDQEYYLESTKLHMSRIQTTSFDRHGDEVTLAGQHSHACRARSATAAALIDD